MFREAAVSLLKTLASKLLSSMISGFTLLFDNILVASFLLIFYEIQLKRTSKLTEVSLSDTTESRTNEKKNKIIVIRTTPRTVSLLVE